MDKKYGLFGTLKAQHGKGEELLEILKQASSAMSNVKGCQLYVVGQDSTDENLVRIFETWDSKEDHDNSLQSPEAQELIQKAMPLLDGAPEKGVELQVAGGVDA